MNEGRMEEKVQKNEKQLKRKHVKGMLLKSR